MVVMDFLELIETTKPMELIERKKLMVVMDLLKWMELIKPMELIELKLWN